MSMETFYKTFGRLKGVVLGMIHLRALPGSPKNVEKMDEIIRIACAEADLYEKAGVDGVIVENMHDRPWCLPGQLGPEAVASMGVVTKMIRQQCPKLPIGVQVLSACNREALAVAMASNLNFIRAEGFVYSHIGDEGLINSCAADLLRYRRSIGAEHIHVFTDIKKKHSSHAITADVNVKATARSAELFLSDGVVLTGPATGLPTSVTDLKDVIEEVEIPVLVGSGVTTDNVSRYMAAAGVIVGSHLKTHGRWHESLDGIRLNHFMKKVNRLREREAEGPESDLLEEGEGMSEEERLRLRIVNQGE